MAHVRHLCWPFAYPKDSGILRAYQILLSGHLWNHSSKDLRFQPPGYIPLQLPTPGALRLSPQWVDYARRPIQTHLQLSRRLSREEFLSGHPTGGLSGLAWAAGGSPDSSSQRFGILTVQHPVVPVGLRYCRKALFQNLGRECNPN